MDVENNKNETSKRKINVTGTEAVYHDKCVACKYGFTEGEIVCAVSYPHMSLVHKHCVPFYDYESGWPHPKPFQWYSRNASYDTTFH